MRIALRQDEGFAILDVLGDVDSHGFAVLKAGLAKLLRNGKNRIILHIIDAKVIDSDVLRELAILEVSARELSGRILIATASAGIKDKVKSFAKPPVLEILPTVAKAMEYSRGLDALDGEEGGEALSEVTAKLAQANKQVASLEAQLKSIDTREITKIREQNAALEKKVKLLEGQVESYVIERRDPLEVNGFQEKFAVLEATIKRLSGEKLQGAKK